MLSFQHPQFLWLLLILIPAYAFYQFALYKKRKVAQKIGDPELVKELTQSYLPKRYLFQSFLIFFSIALVVFAIANPRIPGGKKTVERAGVDVVFALDVSNSMLADDVAPTRLDRAKQVMNRLVDKFGDHRIGIVFFAGTSFLQMPLTTDHSAARMYINAALPGMITTQGTSISDALKRCNAAFDPNADKFKTILLISDGENHEEAAVDVAEELAKSGVIIHTLGIGSAQGAVIKNAVSGEIKKDQSGEIVVSKLNERLLRNISATSGGTYHLYDNTEKTVNKLAAEINNAEKKMIVGELEMIHKSVFAYFLMLAICLLFLEVMISDKRKIKNVKLKPALTTLLFFPLLVSAQISDGNKAYQSGNYTSAIDYYSKAVKKEPSFVAHYNLGNALYKNNQIDESLKSYQHALSLASSIKEKAAVWYNRGVIYQNDNKLDECIEAYKSALRLDPADDEARHNLQKALREKKKQEEASQPQQQQNQPQESQPKQQPSRITRKEAEDKLRALQQQERNLQDKIKKESQQNTIIRDKDW